MTDETKDFDFDSALKALQEGKPLHGQDGILTPLIKKLPVQGELDLHLAQAVTANRKNCKGKKTIKSMDGSFKPKLIKKHQLTLSDDLEQKIIALYGLEVSAGTLSAVTDKTLLQ